MIACIVNLCWFAKPGTAAAVAAGDVAGVVAGAVLGWARLS